MNATEASSFVINDNFFEYIKNNISCKDTSKLLLKKENVEFDKKFAITQIECRNKFKTKIPEILSNQFFLFPKMICGISVKNVARDGYIHNPFFKTVFHRINQAIVRDG